jgi:hypothetical protein
MRPMPRRCLTIHELGPMRGPEVSGPAIAASTLERVDLTRPVIKGASGDPQTVGVVAPGRTSSLVGETADDIVQPARAAFGPLRLATAPVT